MRVRLAVAVRDMDMERETVNVGDRENVLLRDRVAVNDLEYDIDALRDMVCDMLSETDDDNVALALSVCVAVGDGVGTKEMVNVPVGRVYVLDNVIVIVDDGVFENVGVMLYVCVSDVVYDGVTLNVGVNEYVILGDTVNVGDSDSVGNMKIMRIITV